MKKSIFMLALASLALVGCSKDEVIEVQQDAIRFTANAANATRGTATTTTDLLNAGEFKVWAYNATSGETFMSNTTFENESGGNVWVANPTKFWPNDYALNFYAVHPIPSTDDNGITMAMAPATEEATNKQITNFSANTDVADQIDLIYATVMGARKQSTVQAINFRHALSQIVFAAKVPHEELSVDIKSVTVHNVVNKGTFTFPTISTNPHLNGDNFVYNEDADNPDPGETENDSQYGNTYGEWALDSSVKANFAAGISETTEIESEDGQVPLTSDNGALFLLPQSFVGANYSNNTVGGGASNVKPGAGGEIYFILECKIRQGGNYLFGTEETTGNDGYRSVAIPASLAFDTGSTLAGDKWEQGKKYTYIFNFSGGGGYDPDSGDPILVPIKLTVTVDDFQSADDINVAM